MHVAKPYLELLMPLPPSSKFLDAGIALSAKLPQHLKQSCLILPVSVKQGVTGDCLELRSRDQEGAGQSAQPSDWKGVNFQDLMRTGMMLTMNARRKRKILKCEKDTRHYSPWPSRRDSRGLRGTH